MHYNLSLLPKYAQRTLLPHHNMIEYVWNGWCDDIRGVGKKALFVQSTMRTYNEQNRPITVKTADLITQYLLKYFTLEGQSDMVKVGQGFYGWLLKNEDSENGN